MVRIPYVTGEEAGISRERVLLAAASENVMLAPHWWHRVAVEPTSVPHAGHSRGRAFSFLPPPKKWLNCSRNRSSFQRRRGESGNRVPCVIASLISRFYNSLIHAQTHAPGNRVTHVAGRPCAPVRQLSKIGRGISPAARIFLFCAFAAFALAGCSHHPYSPSAPAQAPMPSPTES